MIALLLACAAPRSPFADEVVVRVPVDGPDDLALLEALGADLWSEHVVDAADVRLRRRDLARLPFEHEVLIGDLDQAIEESRAAVGPGFYDDWRPLDEVLDRLDDLDAARGDETELFELGTSVEGQPIRGLRIRSGDPDDRPGILVTGTQHAREWIAASSALWLAEHLVAGLGTDPEVDDLLARYKVMVVPVVNPDGYHHTWTTDRMWRKNRRPNADGTIGVDLNRNWAAGFGGPGSSGAGISSNYRGPAPFSEPETAAVRDWIEEHPRYAVHLDLHSTGQLVLSPWGFTATPSADADLLDGVGLLAADAMGTPSGTRYDAGPVYTRLYPASGIGIDWSYGAHGLNSWLFELRDRGQYGFLLPADQIVPTAEEAWAGLLSLAEAPAARLDLRAGAPLVGGAAATLTVWRTTPGAAVELWFSTTGPGTTLLPDGTALGLDGATLLGAAVARRGGRAVFDVVVPASAAGGDGWFQATGGSGLSIVLSEPIL